jgi:hypothetical protein
MQKKESNFSILFRHWLRANKILTCSLEMKDSRGKDYIAFSEIKQAQIDWGLAINSDKGVLMRMQAVAEGMPDYIYMRNEPAYIVIKYPKSFSIITIGTFLLEKQKSKRKSLTEKRASEISVKTIKIKSPHF